MTAVNVSLSTSSSSSSSSPSQTFYSSSLSSLLNSFPPPQPPPSSSSSSSSPSMPTPCPSSFPRHHQLMMPSASTSSSFASETLAMSKSVSVSATTNESMFSCTMCHKRYSTEKYLQMHLALHKDASTPMSFADGNTTASRKFERQFRPDVVYNGQEIRMTPRNGQQQNRFQLHHYKRHQTFQKRSSTFYPLRHQTLEKTRTQCHYQFLSPPKLLPQSLNIHQQHPQQMQYFSQGYDSNAFAFDQSDLGQNVAHRADLHYPNKEENGLGTENFRNSSSKYHFLALSKNQTDCYGMTRYANDECPHYAEQGSSNLISCSGLSRCTNQRSLNRNQSTYQRYQKASFASLQHSSPLSQAAQIWTCAYCSKTFTQSSNYKNHVRTHSDERPYVCELCSIGFKERYHLKKHLLFKHSTEAKEECRFCGKRFKDSTAVRAHERIHSDQRPYSCQRCRKAFKTSECLWHHENRSRTCGKALDCLRSESATSKGCSAATSKGSSPTFSQPNAAAAGPARQTRKHHAASCKSNGSGKKKNAPSLRLKSANEMESDASSVPSKKFFDQKIRPEENRSCVVKMENESFYPSNYGLSAGFQANEGADFHQVARIPYKNVQQNMTSRSTYSENCPSQGNEVTSLYKEGHSSYAMLRPLISHQRNFSEFDALDKVNEVPTSVLSVEHANMEDFEKDASKMVHFDSSISQSFGSANLSTTQACSQFSDQSVATQEFKTASCRVEENFKFHNVDLQGSSDFRDHISKDVDSTKDEIKALFFPCTENDVAHSSKISTTSPSEFGGRWQHQDAHGYLQTNLEEINYERCEPHKDYANQDFHLVQQTCTYDDRIETIQVRQDRRELSNYQHNTQGYQHHQYTPFYTPHHHHHHHHNHHNHHHQHLLLPTAIVTPIKRLDDSMNGGATPVHLSDLSISPDQTIHPSSSSYFRSNSSFASMMASGSLEDLNGKSLYQIPNQSGNFLAESALTDASIQEDGRGGGFYEKNQKMEVPGECSSDAVDLKSLPPFETFVPSSSKSPLQQNHEAASSPLQMLISDGKESRNVMQQISFEQELHPGLTCSSTEDFHTQDDFGTFHEN